MDNFLTFIEFGFRHILPLGWDHVLFILAMFLNARSLMALVLQASAFTIAHTITLGLAAAGALNVSPDIVEPLIALTIAILALEAIFIGKSPVWRLPVIFAFGLLHGLGFGGQMQLYLENADFWTGLAGFTVGVELGQLAVLGAAFIVTFAAKQALRLAGHPDLYRWIIVRPVAGIIAAVGFWWFLERLGVVGAA